MSFIVESARAVVSNYRMLKLIKVNTKDFSMIDETCRFQAPRVRVSRLWIMVLSAPLYKLYYTKSPGSNI